MKASSLFLSLILLVGPLVVLAQQQNATEKLDTRIDNLGYWKQAAERGLTVPNPLQTVPPAKYTGTEIRAISSTTENSPDVLIIGGATSQSENSVFVDPNNASNALNSNNSTNTPGGGTQVYGANDVMTFDGGLTWDGEIQGAGGGNSGDPAALIGTDGRYFVGFINNASGQSVARSDDQGQTWTTSTVANSPGGFGGLLDKNHLWIDNSTTSPYEGNLYDAWTAFGGQNDNDIEISRSTDGGVSWSTAINVSNSLNAGSHCQGVNITSGPDGEVYAIFVIYDNWPSDEDAIAMARSLDGGQTYESFRIIDNIRGIRTTGTNKDMRVNSFPSATVDISNGANRGNIYVVWPNIGYPGVNSGNDIDVYIIRSEDGGDTWSAPVRVNQDTPGMGKQHYMCWITSDPATGTLSVIFYDDRNVSSNQCEVYCANSYDAGETWEDFKVSDVSFTPSPIPGLASQYFGDYLGISAVNGNVYPVWTDNRTGTALTYTSPYQTSTMSPPTELQATLDEETGNVQLTWQHSTSPTFSYYKIYRNFMLLGTSVFPLYSDNLPAYGFYRYSVTAYYEVEGETGPAITDVQWGNAQAQLTPGTVEEYVLPEGSATTVVNLANSGQLPLEYTAAFSLPATTNGSRSYCTGTGGCGESIMRVRFREVDNISECNGYEDFTSLSTLVTRGQSFTITVNNSTSIYPEDLCGIWVDWNQDENFTNDAPITVNGSPGPGPYTATITVPDDAKNGTTRLRVRIKRGGTLSPCGLAPNGEVEDYSVNVLGWVTASPMEGTVNAGESQDITFQLDAEGMPLGTYEANYTITSNDPDNGEIVVPVIMHVTDIALSATADKYEICFGGSTTLHAQATGGPGNYTYSWTSDPPGFTSTDPDPVVFPEVTTTYYVELTDGGITLQDEVLITIRELPDVDLGEDVAVCEGGEAIFDAGAGFASYLWSNGASGASITVSEPGAYWVEVANEYGCSGRDTVEFSEYPLPAVALGGDKNFCEGTSVMLDAGTGFSSYAWNTGAETYYINVNQPGEYWVLITDENGCTDSDTIVLTMDPLPLAGNVTTGPTSVDNFLEPLSYFTCSEGMHAGAYEWKLEPAEAGIISGNVTSAQVAWASGYTGTANISVRTSNDCGNSAYSAGYTVSVYSSQGLGEQKTISGVRLYPNPNDGNFALQFSAGKEQTLQFQVTTSGGTRILDEQETFPAGNIQKTFNLGSLPAGTYYLLLLDREGRLVSRQQIVVK